jgi:hypothetical protein
MRIASRLPSNRHRRFTASDRYRAADLERGRLDGVAHRFGVHAGPFAGAYCYGLACQRNGRTGGARSPGPRPGGVRDALSTLSRILEAMKCLEPKTKYERLP